MVNTSILISVLINAVLSAGAPQNSLFTRSLDSLSRRATCVPTSAGNAGTDDVPAITAAIKSCGGGGIIQIPSGKTYMIRSVLDFAGCVNCDFQVEGTIKVSDDTTFWNGKTAIISISAISGAQLRSLTGSGLLDGNGQAAWDLFATDSTFKRPTFVLITKASKNIAVSNLKVKNPPNVFFSNNADSANIAYSSLTLTAVSSSSNLPKNTDGFDVGPATYTTFKNISVSNNDDCIAFKRGANYVTVDGITCKGSHGLSVGSVGGSQGVTDTVQNIYVTNAVMGTSTKAVGIKLYPGGSFYGSAIVRNITFDGVTVSSSDYAAQIQSCYNAANAASCAANPSTAQLTDIYFKNFKGTTSTKYGTTIANINCPAAGTCNVYFSGWTVVPPSGTAKYLCANIDSTPGVTCSTGASG